MCTVFVHHIVIVFVRNYHYMVKKYGIHLYTTFLVSWESVKPNQPLHEITDLVHEMLSVCAPLLDKLNDYGVRRVAIDWLKSCLTNREQFVSIEGGNSAETDVCLGVPQRSVLGPLLFLVSVNDTFSSCPNMLLIHYGDDTGSRIFRRGTVRRKKKKT